jgi:hypothetical protein
VIRLVLEQSDFGKSSGSEILRNGAKGLRGERDPMYLVEAVNFE